MINHIQGKLIEKTPTYAVIECNGVGYLLHISLNTYSKLKENDTCKLYAHLAIREDAHLLFGFFSEQERIVFRNLISVSGVGATTARMILSALNPAEVQQAIITGNVSLLKSIKGIGEKTAQRIIVDLKEKIGKDAIAMDSIQSPDNTLRREALSALVTLGYSQAVAEKAIDKAFGNGVVMQDPGVLVKAALKNI